jgi:hypothetical protein
MLNEQSLSGATNRRDDHQHDKRILGYVVQCDGARAVLAAVADASASETTGMWTVGRHDLHQSRIHAHRRPGLRHRQGRSRFWTSTTQNPIEVSVELIGEVRDGEPGQKPTFDRGITAYPHIGAIAHRIRSRDLQARLRSRRPARRSTSASCRRTTRSTPASPSTIR